MAHFLIYRRPRCGTIPPGGFTRQLAANQAKTAFDVTVEFGAINPSNGRRVVLAGPDYTVLPDNPDDPLLIGDVAVKAVLSDQEWQAYLGLTAAAALEA
jgi:hypothetical protein